MSTVVRYTPASYGVFGVLPASDRWTLSVTAPGSGVSFPVTVTLRLVCTDSPVGDFVAPLGYVSFSGPTLTFSSPGETQSVAVSATFPASALTMNVTAGTYAYKVFTDGWGSGITDNGALINASVSAVYPPPGNPPETTIDTPTDGSTFSYAVGAFPAVIPFTFHGTTDATSPLITAVSASFGADAGVSNVIPVVVTGGLGTATVTASGSFTVNGPGTYVLQASSTNLIGTDTDTNQYTVVVTAPAPTVAIATPTPGSTYTYRVGGTPVAVPFVFTAHSYYGGVTKLAAFVDGVATDFVPQGLGTLDAGGTISLSFTSSGVHTLLVVANDDNGYADVTATTNFTINVVAPTPVITLTKPTTGQLFTIPAGASSIDVGYAFTTTSNNGFVVDSVSAMLGTLALSPTTTGLGTGAASSSGTMVGLVPGTYTLTASGTSAGIPVTQSVSFTVQSVRPPPTVVVNAPSPNATFTRYLNGPALSIPLTFTGTSNATDGVITKVTATLDGAPLSVSATLNQKVVSGTATMSVTAAGTHTITVTATDAIGTATAQQTFTVTVLQGSSLGGTIFFDVDTDGKFDAGEIGIAGITVALRSSSGQLLATTTSEADGSYSFAKLAPGTYIIAASPYAGLTPTNGATRTGTVGTTSVSGINIGFMLNFCRIDGMCAGGYTIGYWKNNIDKAIKGSCSGTQVSAATLNAYTRAIGSFALSPYDGITLKVASKTMGSTSSAATALLSKQLIASEYNYENRAYLNGNAGVTYLFVWWGEYVLSHSSNYSTSYIIWAKDWFDAYNNTHGGSLDGPAGSCSTGSSTGCNYGSDGSSWWCSNAWSGCGN